MFHLRKYSKSIGPGVITGASDDDPSGVITYSQTGAQFGYHFLWLALFTTPLMMAVQEMSARLGLVTRQGLGRLIRHHVSRRVALGLALGLLIVNTVNIGADLSAMAAVTRLILPGPQVLYLLLFAALILVLEITVTYARYVNVLKWLTLALFSYVAVAFVTHQDWISALRHTVLPSFTGGWSSWYLITAILGTTISPYLFFWQASEEVEELTVLQRMQHAMRTDVPRRLRAMRRDTALGMVFSNVVMFFIILATASTLHQAGVTDITSAEQAAEALRPLAGSSAFLLFALGIIGTGLLAVPVLAGSAAYALADVFGWPEGLGKTFRQAPAFYVTIGAAILVGGLASLTGFGAVQLLIWAAVLNGLLAPVVLWYINRLAASRRVVGSYTSPPVVRWGGWLTWGLMTFAGSLTIIQFFR
ncbi:MAG: divalent metal cation transporter [Candidatus Kerfeldbacteria bacterium]|nr:divalent metal cation transporter [Candidatus Kerfeldbacteria bacterium]